MGFLSKRTARPIKRRILRLALILVAATAACSDDDGSSGADGSVGSDAGRPDGGPPAVGAFRYGMNFGHRNNDWGDPLYAELAWRVGANSSRVSLPERHLDRWGYDIEVGDMQQYAAIGLGNHVAFLTSPIRAHSTAPGSAEDWELVQYIPANLHEPIWLTGGDVNPDNYWANYVHQTVSTYHPWVRVWEVWNEPDWVSDWNVTLGWDTAPPLASELPRFNGSIYDYVRMLRITWEVVQAVDPTGRVATGGLGYPTFLSAILRYTDNPADGSVTADHPQTGGAYFDVLSFHHYPLFTAGNSEVAVDSLLTHRDNFQAVLDAAGVTGKGWVVTESGAPHVALTGEPSGPAYARNYLLKAMTLAQTVGIEGVDWFLLTDTASPGNATSAFELMGLYTDILNLQTIDEAVPTDSGRAYATLGTLLTGATYDASVTAGLGLSAGARGAAFRYDEGHLAYVLWAVPAADEEAAQISVTLPVSDATGLRAHAWDGLHTGLWVEVPVTSGEATVELTGTPQVFVQVR